MVPQVPRQHPQGQWLLFNRKVFWLPAWLWLAAFGILLSAQVPIGVTGEWVWSYQDTVQFPIFWLIVLLIGSLVFEGLARLRFQMLPKGALVGALATILIVRLGFSIIPSGPWSSPGTYWSLIVSSPVSTTFFLEAREAEREGVGAYLSTYHQGLSAKPFHAATHPPGMALFFAAGRLISLSSPLEPVRQWLLNDEMAQILAEAFPRPLQGFVPEDWKHFRTVTATELQSAALLGLMLVLLNSAAYLIWWLLLRSFVSRDLWVFAAVLPATTPGTLFWMPAVDSMHLFLIVLQLFLFHQWMIFRATNRGWLLIILLGFLAGGSLFTAFKNAIPFLCLLAYGAWLITKKDDAPQRWVGLIQLAVLSALAISPFLVAWLFWGFEPVATFWEASKAHSLQAGGHSRSWLPWLFANWWEFALSLGGLWITLTAAYLLVWWRAGFPPSLTVTTLTILLFLDLTGFVRGETARLWAPFALFLSVEPIRLLPSIGRPPPALICLQGVMNLALVCRLKWLVPW
ncbi:MAG: hypothetical protein NZ959_08805 [Armatimonadetes bacterium]|nr:hypothetical protein [Armatimonadota bacterium]MDW8121478.1 hypothetical protein [Armatimonadota bacterium]